MLLVETAINRYLALDPEMLDKIEAFSGKVIKLEITGLNKTLYMLPVGRSMQVRTKYEGEADTTLRGTPISLFKMGLATNVARLLLKGEVEISGDTRLGHQFKNIFSQMDIDWSEPLANLVGDTAAYKLQQSGMKLGTWGKDTMESVSMSISEYLQEESRDLVSEAELNNFNDEVDQLRNDVDRLQARINALSLKQ